MSQQEQQSGAAAEAWVKEFAKTYGILSSLEFSLEKVVKLLDEKLQFKLSRARPHLSAKFSFANEWLDSILYRTGRATGKAKEKAGLAALLLDSAMATDVIFTLRDNHGKEQVIAVDVTSNPHEEQYKLNTIRGQRDHRDFPGFNQNANIANARKELGIDKHLVLVINPKKPPQHEALLNELYTFANHAAKTSSINLFLPFVEIPLEQQKEKPSPLTPQELWQKYSNEAKTNSNIQRQVAVVEKALQSGLEAKLPDILACDPFVQKIQREQGGQKAQNHIQTIIRAVTIKLEASKQPERSLKQKQGKDLGSEL